MPQLNPNPWFFIMLMSWLTFSFILQPKLLTFISTNLPSDKTTTTPKTSPWNWPWT
uniref:ATP synthase complex subunit 8 n=1 Tax=Xiphorhynchus elegans TaxID=269412 RepID=A0A7L8DAN4_9DEND|nr:ATP synthase F0 subunit 8 [Xiphorhynchus elegans]QOD97139.1 ATP synthase F0 subunit 8 [Xiphorhynchus elegans]